MQHIHALTLASMQHDMARLDQIASNLANVATPGYQRQTVVARPFADALSAAAEATVNVPEVMTDTRPGTLKTTGQALDVALASEGFFEVVTPQGLAYTRRGSFTVNARGRLVTAGGHAVQGLGGDLQLNGRTPVIDAAGHISEVQANGVTTRVGQLKVVRFDKGVTPERLGDGLVAAGEGLAMVPESQVQIRQGALENANVNTAQEMVDLIQTMRHFESLTRVVQGYDEMVGSAVRKLTES